MGKISKKESLGKDVEVIWACDVKIGPLCRKEGDGNGSTREQEKKFGQGEG